jgi:peptide/nickel transport system ATP-binding protein
MGMDENRPLLEVKGVKKYFPVAGGGFLQRSKGFIKAVDDVYLEVQAGETLGVVGESGSGKTTLGRCITKLYEATGGEILLNTGHKTFSVTKVKGNDLKEFRRSAQTIFQDPYSSLNPRMNILEAVGEPLLVNDIAKGKDLEDRVTEMILQVGLRVEHLRRFPHSFSGGQRQRIGIARALVVNPRLVVADEPVSALDVSIQAQILNLLQELQDKYQLTYVFISHAMSVIRYVSNRIAVMYAGKLVEVGEKTEILTHPKHPYTELLLKAVPRIAERKMAKRGVALGEPPDMGNLPIGCVFVPRCPYAKEICMAQMPELRKIATGAFVSCHRAEELDLLGIKGAAL